MFKKEFMKFVFVLLSVFIFVGCNRSDTTIREPDPEVFNPPVPVIMPEPQLDPAYLDSTNGYSNSTASGGYKVKVRVGQNEPQKTLNASGGYKVEISIKQ